MKIVYIKILIKIYLLSYNQLIDHLETERKQYNRNRIILV